MLSGNGVMVTDYYSKVSVSRKGEAVTSWFGCEIPRICRCATYNTPGLVERSSKLDARHAPLITTPAPAVYHNIGTRVVRRFWGLSITKSHKTRLDVVQRSQCFTEVHRRSVCRGAAPLAHRGLVGVECAL